MKINTCQTALSDITILDDDAIVAFADDVQGALLEVHEARVRHLNVGVDRDAARCLICLVTNELATDQVERGLRERHQGRELLIEPVWD